MYIKYYNRLLVILIRFSREGECNENILYIFILSEMIRDKNLENPCVQITCVSVTLVAFPLVKVSKREVTRGGGGGGGGGTSGARVYGDACM